MERPVLRRYLTKLHFARAHPLDATSAFQSTNPPSPLERSGTLDAPPSSSPNNAYDRIGQQTHDTLVLGPKIGFGKSAVVWRGQLTSRDGKVKSVIWKAGEGTYLDLAR